MKEQDSKLLTHLHSCQIKFTKIYIDDNSVNKIKEVLERIASKSTGKFYQALKPEELELIYSEINKLESKSREQKLCYIYSLFSISSSCGTDFTNTLCFYL